MPFLFRCPGCDQYYVIPQPDSGRHKCRCRLSIASDYPVACSQSTASDCRTEIVTREAFDKHSATDPFQRPFTDLIPGTLASALGCCSTVVLWISLAVALRTDVGWMAWAVGGFTGFGMSCRKNDCASIGAGVLAAVIASSGVMIAKAITFFSVVLPLLHQIPSTSDSPPLTLFGSSMLKTIDFVFLAAAAFTAYWLGSRGASNESGLARNPG